MREAVIYYFSGTGNSLHVAKELQKLVPGAELVPIASLLDRSNLKLDAQAVGFVFPVHLSTIPIFILDFVAKLDLSSVGYVFAAASRIGTQHSGFSQLDKLLQKKGKRLNAFANFNMPSNDPKFGFKACTAEELRQAEIMIIKQLGKLAGAIRDKRDFRPKDVDFKTRVPFVNALAWLVKLTDNMQQKFYADDKCAGCGTCTQVCPVQKIIIKDGKPFWRPEIKCLKCYACLNFCPQQAVQIKGYTEGKGRYSHPFASIEDMIRQRNDDNF